MKTTILLLLTISVLMSAPLRAHDKPIVVNDKQFKVSIPATTIEKRVQELGQQLYTDYHGKKPIFIGVLSGAVIFLADLVRATNLDCEIDFIKISSYGDSDFSSETITLLQNLSRCVENRDVIIVEDIIETGNSMKFLLEHVAKLNPKSIRIATLLHKNVSTLDFPVDYVGFNIEPAFVIGYGLDYAQTGRNLKDIYALVS